MENTQKSYLLEISKWEKFFGILTAVAAGLVALIGVAFIVLSPRLGASEEFASAGKIGIVAIGVLYVLLSGICVIPAFFLLKSSKSLKNGLLLENEDELNGGLKNCKSFFKFESIVALISLCAAAVISVVMIVSLFIVF